MTGEELQAIKARCEAATPGPWIGGRDADLMRPLYTFHIAVSRDAYEIETDHFLAWERNADFIAHAREDVATLLAEVERLREALEIFADRRKWLLGGEAAWLTLVGDDGPWNIAREALDKALPLTR